MSVAINNGAKKPRKRIFYLDALRALAILAVIFLHVGTRTTDLVLYGAFGSVNWFINDIMIVCFRFGVPLFLMLAGALSLGREWDIKTFLGKRLPRIIEPFIFWGLILSALVISCSYLFPNVIGIVKTFDFSTISNYVIGAFLAKSKGFNPYWFFWMILGTYLIMPIFNKWLLHSDLKEAEYFLCIWLITTIFDFTLMKSFPVKLSYFTSPIGFTVLGYYLRHTKRKIFNNFYIPIILIIVGFITAVICSYMLSTPKSTYYFDRYSIFMAAEVTGIFLLFRNLDNIKLNINFFSNPKGIFRRSISSIAKYSYGFYLIHYPILTMMIIALKECTTLGFIPIVLISFIGIILISWLLMALLNGVPYINKVIGAK